MNYGRDFDWSKSFFEQLRALTLNVPKQHTSNGKNENSDYTDQCSVNKNCYLIFV